MAQQSDSINYANILDVKMDRMLNGIAVETFDLNRTELSNKDSGTFAYPFQVFYTTNHPILQDGSEYKIKVTNTETGVIATSQTKIVKTAQFYRLIRVILIQETVSIMQPVVERHLLQ